MAEWGGLRGGSGGGRVAALVAVNSAGAVRDPARGSWVAGARGPRGRIVPPGVDSKDVRAGTGTTLTVILTDLEVPRPTLQRAAAVVHAALGGVVVPYHSATDGDVLFAVSTGLTGPPPKESRPGGTADALGFLASAAAIDTVLGAVRTSHRPR